MPGMQTGPESSTDTGSASQDDNGAIRDGGTITVDVIREQPDTGLVVTISEQETQARKSDPATCVTYGTATVVCDPDKTVNSEELTLLRFLGKKFVDPNKLDEKAHWRLDESQGTESATADYTIASSKNGVATIDERRIVNDPGAMPITTDVSTTLEYDMTRAVPTAVQEYAVRRESSSTGPMKMTVQTTLTLVSDSTAKQ